MMRMNARSRKMLLTGLVAFVGAVFAEHMVKPGMKRKLKV